MVSLCPAAAHSQRIPPPLRKIPKSLHFSHAKHLRLRGFGFGSALGTLIGVWSLGSGEVSLAICISLAAFILVFSEL